MLPAVVYESAPAHIPTAFTEHYPVVHYAKYALGLRVVMALDVFAYHADLVRHGETWHKCVRLTCTALYETMQCCVHATAFLTLCIMDRWGVYQRADVDMVRLVTAVSWQVVDRPVRT